MLVFYKKWKKYNEIQLTENEMDLNNQKMTNHQSSPVTEEDSKQRREKLELKIKVVLNVKFSL